MLSSLLKSWQNRHEKHFFCTWVTVATPFFVRLKPMLTTIILRRMDTYSLRKLVKCSLRFWNLDEIDTKNTFFCTWVTVGTPFFVRLKPMLTTIILRHMDTYSMRKLVKCFLRFWNLDEIDTKNTFFCTWVTVATPFFVRLKPMLTTIILRHMDTYLLRKLVKCSLRFWNLDKIDTKNTFSALGLR